MSARQAADVLDAGCHFVMVGKAAVLVLSVRGVLGWIMSIVRRRCLLTEGYLRETGLSESFIDYMRTWNGFVTS